MAGRNLSIEQQVEINRKLVELQKMFPYTVAGLCFLAQVIINTLIVGKPNLNRIQADILSFLLTGNKYRMVMAQRGQAKTTLTAIYAVFMLIHNPHYRIVIFSQNAKRAKEIAGWIIKIFYAMPILECLRPDKFAGDRSSIEAFDIHWCLRGSDKSPSVSCYSIESGAQGARADLIIADDIESLQNSRTAGGRQILMDSSLEFESINQFGSIIYLGTPQSVESIYNWLPSRGYQVRIWTGRYPTPAQMEDYGDKLAPILLRDIEDDPSRQYGGGLDNSLGQPTCPEMYPNDILNEKELTQGKAKFMLQFMLNTGLSDADRYPLRISDCVVANFSMTHGPVMPIWCNTPATHWQTAPKFGSRNSDRFFLPMQVQYDLGKFERTVMFIDPAGGGKNGDETGYAIIKLIGTTVYLWEAGGVKGGYNETELEALVQIAKRAECKEVFIEDNYGNGAHIAALKPYFEREWPVTIEAVHSTGQKELRIIDNLEPVLSTHRFVVRQEVVQADWDSIQKYPAEVRMSYSLFHQLANLTREKDCLRHDDRLEAVAAAVAIVVADLDYDQMKVVLQRQIKQQGRFFEIMRDPKQMVEYMQNMTLGVAVDVAMAVDRGFQKLGNRFSGASQSSRGALPRRSWGG
ncbi:large terminase subunit [Pseudomonas phage Alpheus]|uniref:Large terminase subunit n=1 Tax=Pseudomonas phage Alpheus TaxID=2163983 RepID=A0A2S1GN18_9CAUD|nr:terminase large subunit [Pseudomonas phage Alpheus]AWD90766.1 large terminase subunit [Pseudomonas phage Alpheus]